MFLVVFVHGFRWEGNISGARGFSFSRKDNFRSLEKHLKNNFGNCTFKRYEYPTGIFNLNIHENLKPEGRTLNFDFSSRELKNEITKYISVIETERPRNSQDTSNLRIVLIGHSAGGIVIRHALVIDYISSDN
jgi:hypothetical protein